jgi:hypothetical protein
MQKCNTGRVIHGKKRGSQQDDPDRCGNALVIFLLCAQLSFQKLCRDWMSNGFGRMFQEFFLGQQRKQGKEGTLGYWEPSVTGIGVS